MNEALVTPSHDRDVDDGGSSSQTPVFAVH